MFPKLKFSESEILETLSKITVNDVQRVLNSPQRIGFHDFLVLISPAARECMDILRDRAAVVRRSFFGRTVRFYAPLYISNYCCNECVYCGFRASNKAEIRRRITLDEIMEEVRVIKKGGIDSLLLVSGEDPKAVNVEFFEEILPHLKKLFNFISLEIQPLPESDYRRLVKAGIHGLALYQETYNAELYAKLHLKGPKKHYQQRLDHLEYAARAGFHQIGLGALLGLYNWRSEAISLAAHGLWIMKNFWRSKVNFSFPRITPAGNFIVPAALSEADLEQMILAFRILFPENDIFLSTRESAPFRDRLAHTAATIISAGSKVSPGAYAQSENHELPQFTMNDSRSTPQMVEAYQKMGFEVVFKDWDTVMDLSERSCAL